MYIDEMQLKELIKGIPIQETQGRLDIEIIGITQDSRKVKKGDLFVAIPGHDSDGHRFIPDAVRQGAAAVVSSQPLSRSVSVPHLLVEDSRQTLADLSARFYQDPSMKLTVIGVTGTNGKTTVTFLLESILREAGRRPAVIGTVNCRFAGKTFPAETTTPESVDLQRLFSEMLQQGVTDVVMEVSSHALKLGRVRGVHFDVAAFTNLSQDHLDFHHDLEDYFQSKLRLFSKFLAASKKAKRFAVVNFEDPRGRTILEEAPIIQEAQAVQKIRTGLTGPYEVSGNSFKLSPDGIEAELLFGSSTQVIRSSLIGQFNLENILVAAGVAHSLGISSDLIARGIEKVASVPGRLEKIPNDRGLHIFIDYAHTPDAIARVGHHLRKFASERLITVFGCGGDRDRSKRPMMGREAGIVSDLVIITSDNPRTENPEEIIDQILPGLREIGYPEEKILRIVSREEALRKALEIAHPGDFLLIAGKGHEDYQIIGKEKVPFSDKEVLKKLLAGAGR